MVVVVVVVVVVVPFCDCDKSPFLQPGMCWLSSRGAEGTMDVKLRVQNKKLREIMGYQK